MLIKAHTPKGIIEREATIDDFPDYAAARRAEYPPIADYLDGIVKGDQTQVDKYIADCMAVKAKYPKSGAV